MHGQQSPVNLPCHKTCKDNNKKCLCDWVNNQNASNKCVPAVLFFLLVNPLYNQMLVMFCSYHESMQSLNVLCVTKWCIKKFHEFTWMKLISITSIKLHSTMVSHISPLLIKYERNIKGADRHLYDTAPRELRYVVWNKIILRGNDMILNT